MDSAGAAPASPSMAARTFLAPTVKRSDSGVALGLFSKIAAARKEKLSLFASTGAAVYAASGDADAPRDRRGSVSPAVGGSQFPEIHDPAGRSHTRVPVLNSPLKKGRSSRNAGQPQRWTKLDDARSGRASPTTFTTPPITTPVFPIARGPHPRAITPERPQRLVHEIGRGGALPHERILPLDDLGTRPSTAGDEPAAFGQVRGYVRRAVDGGTNSVELPSQRRSSDWTRSRKPSTADAAARRISSPLVVRGQPEVVLLEPPNKPAPEPTVTDVHEQEIYFAEATEIPGVPVVYRHQKAKAINPERLNLDRRNLPILPLLEGEQMLRLLNLQNNVIHNIDNLSGLPNLIFLDLYNNRIERLENLHVVPNLRVLMLGKNRLQRIENLDTLKKLDVLDLHSNELERMENLNELTELRVLNLGGNRIKCLEGIDKLHLLTELNLRRNSIATISSTIGRLPSLQRLFLSNNKLETLASLDPLLGISSVVELRLDNNVVCELNQAEYRSQMIKCFPLLKHLDLRPLSDAERKDGLQFYSQARAASKEREELEEVQRGQAIAHIRSLWEKRERIHKNQRVGGGHGGGSSTSQVVKRHSGNLKGSESIAAGASAWGRPRASTSGSSGANSPPVGNSTDDEEIKPTSREEPTSHNNSTGYSEIEVHGDYRVLAIYGEALDVLDSAKVHACVHAIKFQFVSIARIKAIAASSTSANIKLFSRLRRLNFAHNDIESFDQLSWLGAMGSRSEELFVTHNSVCSRSLFRNFVAARITNVARLNGREITTAERTTGRQIFQKMLTRLRPPDSSSEPATTTRAKDGKSHLTSRGSMPSFVMNDIVVAAAEMEKKNTLVEDSWRSLLTALVQETLQEIAQKEGNYMSGCLDGL